MILLVCIFLEIIVFFAIAYCYDVERIWSDEKTPQLYIPRLEDLKQGHTLKEQQMYVDTVILPAKEYFLNLEKIERCQKHKDDTGSHLAVHTFPCIFFSSIMSLEKFFGSKIADFSLSLVISVVVFIFIYFVYNHTKLKLGVYDESFSNIDVEKERKKGNKYFFWNEYLPDHLIKSIYVILHHKNYVELIANKKVESRYQLRKIIDIFSLVSFLGTMFVNSL